MTNTTTKKKGKRGRVVVALCDWLASLTPCERAVAELYRLRYLYQNNNSNNSNNNNDNNITNNNNNNNNNNITNNNNNNNNNNITNNNNTTTTTNKKGSPTTTNAIATDMDLELLSQVGPTMTHLLTLLYTSTPTLALASVAGATAPATTSNSVPETPLLITTSVSAGPDQPPIEPQQPQMLPLVGNLRLLRSLHSTDLLVEVSRSCLVHLCVM